MTDGLDGDDLKPTGCTVLGIHVVKGFIESVAFEAEAVGSWTGNANFEGVTFGGEQGNLITQR